MSKKKAKVSCVGCVWNNRDIDDILVWEDNDLFINYSIMDDKGDNRDATADMRPVKKVRVTIEEI